MIGDMRSACRSRIEYVEGNGGCCVPSGLVQSRGSTARSLYSTPTKLSAHDSSQALLPSTSASFDASEPSGPSRDYGNGEAGEWQRPMWRGYCIWLITILLIATVLTLLYLYVMMPIFNHIDHQQRQSTPTVTFITRTTQQYRNPSTAEEFTQLFTVSNHSNPSISSNYDTVITTGKSITNLVQKGFYTMPVYDNVTSYKSSTVEKTKLNFAQRTTHISTKPLINSDRTLLQTNFDTNTPVTPIESRIETKQSNVQTTVGNTKALTTTLKSPKKLVTRPVGSMSMKPSFDVKTVSIDGIGNMAGSNKYGMTFHIFTPAITRSTTPITTTMPTTGWITKSRENSEDKLNPPNTVFEHDDDIRPIEISVVPDDFSLLPSGPEDVSQEIGELTPELIWHGRLPPQPSSLPTPIPPPSSLSFSVSASVVTMQRTDGEDEHGPKTPLKKESHQSRAFRQQRRRQAPVIVTSLLDIGRDRWPHFTRHFDTYLDYFEKLFRLDNFMIIYCELKVLEFIRERVRDIDVRRLQVVELRLEDLPLYRYRDEMQAILDDEQSEWLPHWDRQMRSHPEARYADYDVLVNSKPYLLNNATHISRFGSANQLFVWLDAGYGHGSENIIPEKLWIPSVPPSLITVIKLTTILEKVEGYKLSHVYRKQKAVISGGFLAGGVAAIRRLNTFFFKTFMELLDDRRVDDDQTVLLITIRNYRRLFNVVHGGWFDAFKLFP